LGREVGLGGQRDLAGKVLGHMLQKKEKLRVLEEVGE
jgi:hypothetical protein